MSKKSIFHKKKLLKILGASGLAIMMGIGTLCGVLINPMNSAQATISSPENATTNLTAEEQAKAELDANILAGSDLGLDPENDPVIAITNWGLEIKYSAATLSSPQPLAGYAYVTMASNNWVIIGQSSSGLGSSFQIPTYVKGWATSSYVEKNSAAGNAIWADTNLGAYGIVNNGISGTVNFSVPNATKTAELKAGQVLCLSQESITHAAFDLEDVSDFSSADCDMKKYLENYYNTKFSAIEKRFIQNITLKSRACNRADSSYSLTSTTAHMFPLAYTDQNAYATDQNFRIETYLTSESLRAYYHPSSTNKPNYWTRTGWWGSWSFENVYSINSRNGSYYGNMSADNTNYGYRPAFVLQLT